MRNIEPSINLYGERYYNCGQIADLVYMEMEKNGRWKNS